MVSIAPRSQSPPMAGFLMRSRLSFTASASTSRPLWNSTPLRSRKVQAVSSLLGSQLSAMPGTMLPSWSRSVRPVYITVVGMTTWF